MICDRIVVGILDKSLAERLQLNAALTLDGCIKLFERHGCCEKTAKIVSYACQRFCDCGHSKLFESECIA